MENQLSDNKTSAEGNLEITSVPKDSELIPDPITTDEPVCDSIYDTKGDSSTETDENLSSDQEIFDDALNSGEINVNSNPPSTPCSSSLSMPETEDDAAIDNETSINGLEDKADEKMRIDAKPVTNAITDKTIEDPITEIETLSCSEEDEADEEMLIDTKPVTNSMNDETIEDPITEVETLSDCEAVEENEEDDLTVDVDSSANFAEEKKEEEDLTTAIDSSAKFAEEEDLTAVVELLPVSTKQEEDTTADVEFSSVSEEKEDEKMTIDVKPVTSTKEDLKELLTTGDELNAIAEEEPDDTAVVEESIEETTGKKLLLSTEHVSTVEALEEQVENVAKNNASNEANNTSVEPTADVAKHDDSKVVDNSEVQAKNVTTHNDADTTPKEVVKDDNNSISNDAKAAEQLPKDVTSNDASNKADNQEKIEAVAVNAEPTSNSDVTKEEIAPAVEVSANSTEETKEAAKTSDESPAITAEAPKEQRVPKVAPVISPEAPKEQSTAEVESASSASALVETPAPSETPDTLPTSKQQLREKIWLYMTEKNLMNYPFMIFNRIPNFKGVHETVKRLEELDEFKAAQLIMVSPDATQRPVKYKALANNKEVLTPTTRLRSGLFMKTKQLKDGDAKNQNGTKNNMRFEDTPIGLDSKVKVDLVVIGSVCVDKLGHRIGKGEGFADLEFAIMKKMGAVDENTVIVTTVHDCQVVDDIPSDIYAPHDAHADIIITPTQVIRVESRLKKPSGIIWEILSERKLKTMPILQEIKEMEEKNGCVIKLKEADSDDETYYQDGRRFRNVTGGRRPNLKRKVLRADSAAAGTEKGIDIRRKFPFSSQRKRPFVSKPYRKRTQYNEAPNTATTPQQGRPKQYRPPRRYIDFTVKLSNISSDVRVRDLKNALIDRGVRPYDISWRGPRGFCFVHFSQLNKKNVSNDRPLQVETIVANLQQLKLGESSNSAENSFIVVEPAEPITRIEAAGATTV